jgi:hypothetical protein
VHLYSDREIETPQKGQPFCYEVYETLRFYWRHGEREIFVEHCEKGDERLEAFWFVHQFLPLYLAWREDFVFFHAAGIQAEDRAIFFLAPSNGGKSTMTGVFLRHGHRLITDDTLPTYMYEDAPMYCPAVPYFRPYRAYETLGEHTEAFDARCGRVDTFYLLRKAPSDAPVRIKEIKGMRKFAELRRNGLIYSANFMHLEHTAYLFDFLRRVKVFAVERPWNIQRLDEVYEAIVEHIRSEKK